MQNKSSLSRIAVFFGMVLVAAGCGPAIRYYVQLEPLSTSVELPVGDSAASGARRQAEIGAIYLGEHKGAIEIALRIRNLSDSDLAVEPSLVSGRVKWIDTAGRPMDVPATILDRTELIRLSNLDKAKVEAMENPHKANGADVVVGMLDAGTGLATLFGAKETKEEEERRDERRREAEQRRRDEASFEEQRLAAKGEVSSEILYLQEKVWGSAILRRGETIEKSLLVGSYLDGDTLMLVVPVGREKHRFVFRQTKIRLN